MSNITNKPAPIVGVPPMRQVELSIPLTFTVYQDENGTVYPVATSNEDGALCLATVALANDPGAKAAIAQALGMPGAYVSGNVGVYLTKAKVTEEMRRLGTMRRAAMLQVKGNKEAKPAAGVSFRIA